MKDNNKIKTRREFLRLKSESAPSVEKVKMLTPDGKLVEVDREVILRASNKKKASNQDILKWSKANPYDNA